MKIEAKHALVIAAVALIVIGAKLGEMDEVMRKAVMICLECIGLG